MRWFGWSVCAALAIAADAAGARPATYVCGEDLEVKVDFTPRKAQLHLREKDYTLQRVKSAHDGHFVNSKDGLEVVAKKGDMLLREGKNELWCRMKVEP
ncbi:MAG TPA: hypothetical protein VFU71_16390 [Burkholderiaceae bacterium]|nr:hypothetical protein [Burkholderiaceae bacterium]